MGKKATFREALFGHVAGFVFCVLFPGFVSRIAPASWIELERESEVVAAHVKSCVFFVIPFKTQKVVPLLSLDERIHHGTWTSNRRGESKHRSEDEGFLHLVGDGESAEVSVSPANLKSVKKKIEEFLAESHPTHLRIFVVANWKFGFFAAGALSSLTLLYSVGVTLSILRGFMRLFRHVTSFTTQ